MGRLRLVVFVVLALAAPPGAPRAAEVTRVATAGEKENPFDLQLTVRWDRVVENFTVTRERALDASEAPPFGRLQDTPQLDYERIANTLVPRVTFGVYEGVELHAELPWVLADDRAWKWATVNGTPANTLPGGIAGDGVDAMNRPCSPGPGGTCFFPAPATVYHGGVPGDLVAGAAWAILDDAKDRTTASWVVGVDVTFPTAKRYDPGEGRGATNWISPHAVPANPGNVGEKIWRFDFHTALSRRYGPIDPYIRLHASIPRTSSQTYSNCDRAAALAANSPVAQFTNAGVENCASSAWEDEAGAQPPWIAGMLFGLEVVPYEQADGSQKVTLDLRGAIERTGEARFYNPLTDATGKLMWTEAYTTAEARLGLYLRASRFVTFDAVAAYAHQTDHLLSGEDLGRAGAITADEAANRGETSNPALNPNFDWRWDAPGRRFRMRDSGTFTVSFAFQLAF